MSHLYFNKGGDNSEENPVKMKFFAPPFPTIESK